MIIKEDFPGGTRMIENKLAYGVVIPAYRPTNNLTDYVQALLKTGIPHIIVIDDGNSEEYDTLFNKIERINKVILLRHKTNLGKGAGLKTAFKYILSHNLNIEAVVTADADGQHLVEDVVRVGNHLIKTGADAVFGVRDFKQDNVPFRSWLGNFLASNIFKLLSGYYIHDTQTGLRGIAIDELDWLSELSGNRFDYESLMLVYLTKQNKYIEEVTISTIYDENHQSNFDTFSDTFHIAKLVLGEYFGFSKGNKKS